jgi:UDP-N-acetylmuramyl pentapeptide phosphotransferase/UDP-N-acetylglucosamine-1-phosphate transferase
MWKIVSVNRKTKLIELVSGPAVGVGVLLLLIGFVAFVYGYPTVQEFQTSLGQIGRLVDPDLQQRYQTALFTTEAGGLMLLVGFIVLVVGLASGHKEPTRYQPSVMGDEEHLNVIPWSASREAAETTVFCIFCGYKLSSDARYCRKCGREQVLA